MTKHRLCPSVGGLNVGSRCLPVGSRSGTCPDFAPRVSVEGSAEHRRKAPGAPAQVRAASKQFRPVARAVFPTTDPAFRQIELHGKQRLASPEEIRSI